MHTNLGWVRLAIAECVHPVELSMSLCLCVK